MVDRRVHRGRRPRVRRADPAARRRGAGRCDAGARRRVRRRADHPAGRRPRRCRWPSASTRRGTRSAWPPSGGARPGSSAAGADDCRSPTARSTPSSRASCSSTSTRSTRRSPRSPGSSHRAAGSASSSTTRCCRRPGSGWIDDQVIDPPEQYWRIGPYLVEAETIEEVELGVHIRFIHRPLSRYVNALAGQRAARRADGRAGAAARVPRPRRRSTPSGDRAPAALPPRPQVPW